VVAKSEHLKAEHVSQRLQFALSYGPHTPDWWRTVLYSNEKTFGYAVQYILSIELYYVSLIIIFIYSSDECGRVYVYRKNGTRFDSSHIQSVQRSGRTSVPVWAWFSADGPGDFVQIEGRLVKEKYFEILEKVLLPSIRLKFPKQKVKFVQDQSPVHTSRIVKRWFIEHWNELELLPWPPKGADLNPIENVWGDIVKLSESKLASKETVFKNAKDAWNWLGQRPDYWINLSTPCLSDSWRQ
jgi:transposase